MNSTTSSQNDGPREKTARFDADIIRNFILGGLGIAGTAGFASAYMNHMENLRRQSEAYLSPKRMLTITPPGVAKEQEQEREREKDDTKKSSSEKSATWSRGIGLTGGLLGGLGMYGLIRAWSQAQKAHDHARRLELAHDHYFNKLRQKQEQDEDKADGKRKYASRTQGMTASDAVLAALFGTPLLLGVAGMIGTNKFLDNRYPLAKNPIDETQQYKLTRRKPRLMGSLRYLPDLESQEKKPRDEEEKSACLCELMLHTVRGDEKRAAAGQWDVLLKAAGTGAVKELRAGFRENAIDGMFTAAAKVCDTEPVKSASTGSDKLHLGAYWLARDPVLGPTVATLVASEYADMNENLRKTASGLPEDVAGSLVDLAADAMECIRGQHVKEALQDIPEDLVKEAYDVSGLVASLLERVSEPVQHSTEEHPQQEEVRRENAPAPTQRKAAPERDPVDLVFA